MEDTGTIEAAADTPVTAEWLRCNTRIRGWLSLFMLALLFSGLRSLAQAVVLSGYFPNPDTKEMKGVLESTRFHR